MFESDRVGVLNEKIVLCGGGVCTIVGCGAPLASTMHQDNDFVVCFVRHGRASFGAADYDVLSPDGQRQAVLLGQRWADAQFGASETLVGPLARHKDTLRLIADQLPAGALGTVTPTAELVEIPMKELMRATSHFADDPRLQQIKARRANGAAGSDQASMLPGIEFVLRLWENGEVDLGPAHETRVEFDARLARLKQALEARGTGVIVAVTSAVVVRGMLRVMNLHVDDKDKDLHIVRTASITTLRFTQGRWHLVAYDDTSHLPNELQCYV